MYRRLQVYQCVFRIVIGSSGISVRLQVYQCVFRYIIASSGISVRLQDYQCVFRYIIASSGISVRLQDYHCVFRYSSSCCSCQVLTSLEFPRQIFEKKMLDIKFEENRPIGCRVVPCGQTDRRTDWHDRNDSLFFSPVLRTAAIAPQSAFCYRVH